MTVRDERGASGLADWTERPRIAVLVVAAHTVLSLAHGVPHVAIPVSLTSWQTAFVSVVVVIAPLVALVGLWRGRLRAGAFVLAVSMAASAVFGAYFHFAVPNPDHVHSIPAGSWQTPFVVTAALTVVVDVLGVAVGVLLAASANDGSVVGRNRR